MTEMRDTLGFLKWGCMGHLSIARVSPAVDGGVLQCDQVELMLRNTEVPQLTNCSSKGNGCQAAR